ncbi:ABC transporter transmembrane domain-containing protein, partial [Xanthomonas fragariae]|uniref:ABC transporter transmembrane domain-containing protein n=1 Tax=Xanthomonas fragariae TaxID=48664 RepID=UPI003530DF27
MARVGLAPNYGWSVNVFTHLVSLSQSYFERRQRGDLQNRFSSIADIQKTLTSRFIEGLLDGMVALLTLLLVLLYSPLLTAIT